MGVPFRRLWMLEQILELPDAAKEVSQTDALRIDKPLLLPARPADLLTAAGGLALTSAA